MRGVVPTFYSQGEQVGRCQGREIFVGREPHMHLRANTLISTPHFHERGGGRAWRMLVGAALASNSTVTGMTKFTAIPSQGVT